MQLYRLYSLRPKEVQAIYDSLGGKYSYRERLARNGTGSPRLYYLGGHPGLDQLRQRASDELRLNFEAFRNGLLAGVTERTEPYIMPLKTADITGIHLELTEAAPQPDTGLLHNLFLRLGMTPATAKRVSSSLHAPERRTEMKMTTTQFTLHCWATPSEWKPLRDFFEKSELGSLLQNP